MLSFMKLSSYKIKTIYVFFNISIKISNIWPILIILITIAIIITKWEEKSYSSLELEIPQNSSLLEFFLLIILFFDFVYPMSENEVQKSAVGVKPRMWIFCDTCTVIVGEHLSTAVTSSVIELVYCMFVERSMAVHSGKVVSRRSPCRSPLSPTCRQSKRSAFSSYFSADWPPGLFSS